MLPLQFVQAEKKTLLLVFHRPGESIRPAIPRRFRDSQTSGYFEKLDILFKIKACDKIYQSIDISKSTLIGG